MKPYSYTFSVMTTNCKVDFFCSNTNKAHMIINRIIEISKTLEKKYNFYDPESYLSAINQRKTQQLDHQTKDLLSRAKLFYTQTDGIFDVTMGTLSASKKHKYIAQVEDEIATLKPFVGVDHFKIKKNKIFFDNPHTLIDLGGFVKEFAVDQSVKVFKKEKIESAFLNFGGDIYAIGTQHNGNPWSVNIQNPLSPVSTKSAIMKVTLENQALTTSGCAERYQKIEDKTYSHIMHKESLQSNIISATVISSSVLESGVYSTALIIQPTLQTSLHRILISDELEVGVYGQ